MTRLLIQEHDYNYLIQQAQKVEQLEKEIQKANAVKKVLKNRINDFRNQFLYINKAINTEIATRNHMEMTEREKGLQSGLTLALNIIEK